MHAINFSRLLNIPEYKVTEIISITDKEIILKVEPYKRNKGKCGGCGKAHGKRSHSSYWVTIRDLPINGRYVFLVVKRRRYKCDEGDRVIAEEIEWIEKWSRVTKRFAEHVNRLTAITTNQEAGWFLGLDDETVYRIDKEMLETQFEEKLIPTPFSLNISVDEVSYRKYYRYLTNVIDVDKKVVTWNGKGRKSEVLNEYYESIGVDKCKEIESVALDGARTYIASSVKYAVKAMIVYDRFHITNKVNKAIDTVRKCELNKARKEGRDDIIELTNCRQRFILLKNQSKLTVKQVEYLDKLCKLNEPIYKSMLLKESFLALYLCKDVDSAKAKLLQWIAEAKASAIEAFKSLADSFQDKMQYILNWFHKNISSAISEGFNNKIKRLKRMAYGYRDVNYFMLKIHQHCGLLNPRLKVI
jgi:transposase